MQTYVKTHAKHTHQSVEAKISNLFHIDETSSYKGPKLNDFQICWSSSLLKLYPSKNIFQFQDFLYRVF